MSQLAKTPPTAMSEPENFEEDEVVAEYIPQHPMLALHSQLKQASAIDKEDHIQNYVEVNPFGTPKK